MVQLYLVSGTSIAYNASSLLPAARPWGQFSARQRLSAIMWNILGFVALRGNCHAPGNPGNSLVLKIAAFFTGCNCSSERNGERN